jgi:hypothetical protein
VKEICRYVEKKREGKRYRDRKYRAEKVKERDKKKS